MQLPEELVTLLGWLGFSWPEADEERMYELGMAWIEAGSALPAPAAEADAAASAVFGSNSGDAIDAFRAAWTQEKAPAGNIARAGDGCQILGTTMIVCAGIVLALKINVIIQLTLLAVQIAQAIATAVVTAGASLLEIPIFREISRLIVDQLVGMALEMILNG